jgi:uncharacterized Zn finger protein
MSAGFPPTPVAHLRRTAGDGPYERGLAYFKKGKVELLVSTADRALAQVYGTEIYRVELHSVAERLHGRCECRAFQDSGFCKHMVAVALAAPEAAIDRFVRLREHLSAQPPEALVERLLRLAERDEGLRRALERECADTSEDDAALVKRYRRDLAEAVEAARELREWRAPTDFPELAAVVDALASLAQARPRPALELVTLLLDEVVQLSGEVDDSEGELFELSQRAYELHVRLCGELQPDPAALAEQLLEWELETVTDLFHAAHEDYLDVLGAEGVAGLTRQARVLWAALPPAKSGTYDGRRPVLKRILDRFDARDLDARVALRKAELSDPSGYLEISGLLHEAGRREEALQWLEEALWVFEDRPDRRLEQRAAELMLEAGRTKDAQALLWRLFERQPEHYAYLALVQVPGEPSRAAEAKALLRARADKRKAWGGEAATLFDIQMAEGDHEGAWDTAQNFDLGDMRLGQIAEASLQTHPGRALAAYRTLAEQCIGRGGAGNYDAAVGWILRRATANPDALEQAAWIADLRLRHKAKRTFIQRLPPAS